jgi:hypothetical protein
LAFHPYPQVIPAVCNPLGFGPPRACSARFTLPMGSSPGFGSLRRNSTPWRTRFRSGSGCPCLSLAAPNHSSAHSPIGTPSPDLAVRLRPARGARFQALFHSPHRGAFHRSLTVLVHYRSPAVFSLGRWSAPLPTRCRVSGGTHATHPPGQPTTSPTGFSPSPTARSSGLRLSCLARRGTCRPLRCARPTPSQQRRQAPAPAGFGLCPLRSPLLRASSLFLRVLRCFTSPGAPHPTG